MNYIKIFSPATVANVSCGFDSIGLALDNMGDTMSFKKIKSGVIIKEITGASLTYNTQKNVASAVVLKMLNEVNADFGVELTIHKGYNPGSGLGSSAASAAGAAWATNLLLGNIFSNVEVTKYAAYGEEIACGSPIVDNVAAVIYGGFILVKSCNPIDIIKLPTPQDMHIVTIHPQIEIRTEYARSVLPQKIKLDVAVKQWSNLGSFVSGLYQEDYELIADSLIDYVAEPARKKLIPHFDKVKQFALDAGALGTGISGSGPTIFSLCKGIIKAQEVNRAINVVYKNTDIKYNLNISKINNKGIKILKQY